MSILTKTDLIYSTTNNYITDALYNKKKLKEGKVIGSVVSASGELGICYAMTCHWIKETFAGNADTAVSFPAHKLSIAQAVFLRAYKLAGPKDANPKIREIFGLKLDPDPESVVTGAVSTALAGIASWKDCRFEIRLPYHITGLWIRGKDFLFFDPYAGCYRRRCEDAEDALRRFLEYWYQVGTEKIEVRQVVLEGT